MIPNAYVGLGSNLGDRAGNLLLAVRGILEAGLEISRLSPIYETQAISDLTQPDFLNQVAELRGKSLPSPEQMLARLLRVEYALGRTRDVPNGLAQLTLICCCTGVKFETPNFCGFPIRECIIAVSFSRP